MGAHGQPLRPQRPARATRAAEPEDAILDPNPRLVSRELLTRDEFQPATTLNLLAAAWIQFEVHDWFSHGKSEPKTPWQIPLAGRRPLARAPDDDPAHAGTTRRADPDRPPTYVTDDSALVGRLADLRQRRQSSPTRSARGERRQAAARRRRACCRPELETHIDLTGVAGNFWVGLALLHTLFMREHNAICDRPARAVPDLDDEELYDKARLVNAALMAKIHTVEWTPAIIAHPTTVLAHARELVGPRRRAARQALRPARRRTRC